MKSLRDLVGEGTTPLLATRTESEDAATAIMPGDDVQAHPLHTEPNPFLFRPYSVLRDALRGPIRLSRWEEKMIRQALDMQQRQHSDGLPGRPG
jgi:hypothetical protein